MLTVAAFEIRHKVIGWKFPLSVVLVLMVSVMAIMSGRSEYDVYDGDMYHAMWPLVNSFVLAAALSVVINGSDDFSTEFDRSTGYVMFTRSVSRNSIFAGKYLSSLVLTLIVALLYIGIMTAFGASMGDIPETYPEAVGKMVLYALAATGAVAFISAVSPRNSISAIASFLLVVVLPMVMNSAVVTVDLWSSLAFSSESISSGFMHETMVYQASASGEEFVTRAVPVAPASIAAMVSYFVVGTVLAAAIFRYRPR